MLTLKKISLTMLIFISCSSSSIKNKHDYLNAYESFISDIKKSWKRIDTKDWDEIEMEYKLYQITYYEKYKDELTPSEHLRLRRLDFAYHFYKGDISISTFFNESNRELFSDTYLEFIAFYDELDLLVSDFRNEYTIKLVDRILSKE